MGRPLVTVVFFASLVIAGCRTSKNEAPTASSPHEGAETTIKIVTVAEVARFVEEKTATIVDANGTDTRKELGVIPGAVLLASSKGYSTDVLPSSKSSKLVFYCGGTMCRASDSAAQRAAQAGYNDVSVLREGIKGWKNAGQPTEMPRS